MKFHKKVLVIPLGIAALAVLAVAVLLLATGISRFSDTKGSLDKSKRELTRYYDEDPFPSEDNVLKEQDNVEVQDEWFKSLVNRLRQGQVESDDKSPSLFMGLLGRKRTELMKLGEASGTALDPRFTFGFGRYFAERGELPAPDDVPRLTEQLLVVERLCALLFDEKVTRLEKIAREEFEGAPVASRLAPGTTAGTRPRPRRPGRTRDALRNPDAGLIPKDELCGKYHFMLEFEAREESVWRVLNRLAKHEIFIAVTGVWFTKQGDDIVLSGQERKGGQANPEPFGSYRRERLVCGPQMEKPMVVRVDLDVYKFREPRD